jgi:ketosteroid isomerase-like protein
MKCAMTDEDAKRQIHDAEEQRHQAMLKADVKSLERIFAEIAIYSHSNGDRETKEAYLEKIANRTYEYLKIIRAEEIILVQGQTGIVLSQLIADVRVLGEDRHLNNRYLSAWVFHEQRWQCLAYQPTVLPTS